MEAVLSNNATSWLGAAKALLRSLAPSAEPQAPTRLKTETGRRCADYVLEAKGLEDLRGRIDVVSGDEEFWLSEAPPQHFSSRGKLSEHLAVMATASFEVPPSLVRVLGDAPTERIRRGHEAWRELANRGLWLVRTADALGLADTAPPASDTTIADALYDTRLPVGMRDVVALVAAGAVSAIVIARAEELGERLPHWIAAELARAYAAAPECLVDSLQFSNIKPLLLEIYREVMSEEQFKRVVQGWVADAAKSDQAVYRPFDRSAREEERH